MKVLQHALFISICILYIIVGCKTRSQEEQLAKSYCASCHMFPSPELLDKKTWQHSVLPQMAFKMGFVDVALMEKIPYEDLPTALRTIPSSPVLTKQELDLIRQYYIKNAPDTIILPKRDVINSIEQFEPLLPASFQNHSITLLKFDSLSHKLYVGTASSELHVLDHTLTSIDSVKLPSPPSHLLLDGTNIFITSMGIMAPSDQAKGQLLYFKNTLRDLSSLLDSLQRPVHVEKSDLNADGNDDLIISAFGNLTGALLLFEGHANGEYSKHTLNASPGTRKVIVKDFNNDGLKDIIALITQGDERIVLFQNTGNLKFKEKVLLRFPPVYGSNYFEIADFNHDGHFDILFTNGDNGDYSIILKPYHAVRIFENDGENNFKETWSFNMPGASQAIAKDFDQDGDLDIAAISFFADFVNTPEQTFLYFENKGKNVFVAHSNPVSAWGRWWVMETGDYDNDHDVDIILGSMNILGLGANADIYARWNKNPSSLLIFQNNLFTSQ